jgi:hypothetical protein
MVPAQSALRALVVQKYSCPRTCIPTDVLLSVDELSQFNPTMKTVDLHLTLRWITPFASVVQVHELKARCLQDCPCIILFVQIAVLARGRTNPLNEPELCDELTKFLPLIVHHVPSGNPIYLTIPPKTATRWKNSLTAPCHRSCLRLLPTGFVVWRDPFCGSPASSQGILNPPLLYALPVCSLRQSIIP